MTKKPTGGAESTRSSGNVFADLGFADPDEELAKAQLLMLVQQAVKRRRLSQAQAAALMGVERSKAAALLHGRGASFSSRELMRLLSRLGVERKAPRQSGRQG